MNCKNYLFFMACMLILTSCAPSFKSTQLYSGPKLSSDKIAILKDCQEKCNKYEVYIEQKKISEYNSYRDTELLPGEYDIKIKYVPDVWYPEAFPKAYQKIIKFKFEAGNIYSIKCELSQFRPFTGYYEPKDWKINIVKSIDIKKCNKIDSFPKVFTDSSKYITYPLSWFVPGYMAYDEMYNNKRNFGAGLYTDFLDRYQREILNRLVFSDEEISAIDKRSIFLGMSEAALALSLGSPLFEISYTNGGWTSWLSPQKYSYKFDNPSIKPQKGEEIFLFINRRHENEKFFTPIFENASYVYISKGKIVRIEVAKGDIKL